MKEAWKGVAEGPVAVYGQGPGASRGLDPEPGETYPVFAGCSGRGGDGPLETGLCGETRLSSVGTARNTFGAPMGSLPETGGVAPEGAEDEAGRTRVAATVALALLVAGALIVGRAVIGSGR